MRSFSLGFVALILLVVPACNFRSSNAEVEVAPAAPAPIPDANVGAVTSNAIEEVEPIVEEPTAEPQFAHDPAPAPPTDSWSTANEPVPANSSSAQDVLNSVARVLKGAVEGGDTEDEGQSTGSIFGSIGRALSKGFQEAAAEENDAKSLSIY